MRTLNPWRASVKFITFSPLKGKLAGRRLAMHPDLLAIKAPWQGKDKEDLTQYPKNDGVRLLGEKESSDLYLRYNDANLVTSSVNDEATEHQLALDIDLPMVAFESQSGEGHYHLYINTPQPIPTKKYMKLLKLLAEVGIIEEGYYKASKAKGYTALRMPPAVREAVESERPEAAELLW